MSQIRSLNRVILVGRVGRNPEITYLPSNNRELAKFSMATNEGYYDQSRVWKDTQEWHNITAWGNLAQKIEKNVAKGDLILVEGKIKTRKWKDQSGQERKSVEIEANNMVVLEKKRDAAQPTAQPSAPADPEALDAFPPAANPTAPFEESPDSEGITYGEGDTEDPF